MTQSVDIRDLCPTVFFTSAVHLGNQSTPTDQVDGECGASIQHFQLGIIHTENYFGVFDTDMLSPACYGCTRKISVPSCNFFNTCSTYLDTQSDDCMQSLVHNGTSRKSMV